MYPTFLLLLSACTGGKGDDSTAPEVLDPATVALAGTCPMETDQGGISLLVGTDETSIDGAVADGVVPTAVLEELLSDGDCKVLRRNNPYCDPACDPGTTCDFDGTCVEYPANQDLGTVSVSGLSKAVSMEAVFPGNTYYDTSLPHPACTAPDVLTLSMPGGTYGPAELHALCPEPYDVTGNLWVIDPSADLVVSWPVPTTSVVRTEMALSLSIDQHGVSPSVLRCVFADDGEGTVSAAALAELVSVGVTGFPTGTLTRRTVDSAPAGAGCMEFTAEATRTVEVDVVGYTPCVSDEDCPDGQTCDLAFQVCE